MGNVIRNPKLPYFRMPGSGSETAIDKYKAAVEKAGEATAELTQQQAALREATYMLAQAELDKTLREEM